MSRKFDGEVYVMATGVVTAHWNRDGKWYAFTHFWRNRVEIAAPCPARIRQAQRAGEQLPPGHCLVAAAGMPT